MIGKSNIVATKHMFDEIMISAQTNAMYRHIINMRWKYSVRVECLPKVQPILIVIIVSTLFLESVRWAEEGVYHSGQIFLSFRHKITAKFVGGTRANEKENAHVSKRKTCVEHMNACTCAIKQSGGY